MKLNNSKLIGIELDSLVLIIGQAVAKELNEIKKQIVLNSNKPNEEILSRKQTADFLQISLTTLWSYDKNQILPSKRIGTKVYYLKSELINFLKGAA